MTEPSPEQLEILLGTVMSESGLAHIEAERLACTECVDYLGRLTAESITIDTVFDEHPEGDLPLKAAQDAYGAFRTIAAIAIAQMAFIRLQHPTLES